MKSKTLFYLILITFLASLIPAMHAQTFSVIHNFAGGPEGKYPTTGVTVRGNALYGTTPENDPGCGTVYQLVHSGSDWTFTTLAALPDNCGPSAIPVFGPDGHLYSTSAGPVNTGGTVFKLTPPVGICRTLACYWTVSNVHVFDGDTGEGASPVGDLVWDQQGNIYGANFEGPRYQDGTVWELSPSGDGYTATVLYTFSGPDGAYPNGVVFDNNGNLFGSTRGAYDNLGNVFELTYVPGVGWTEKALYSFQGNGDGGHPGGVVLDSAGNLYGTSDAGIIFELSPSGNSWTFSVVYTFPPGTGGGGLAFGPDGALYGYCCGNGFISSGSVFKLTKTQNGWQFTSLHVFPGGYEYPEGTVAFDAQGNLYGTAYAGGKNSLGYVWMITP